MELKIGALTPASPAALEVEVVERKGLGHPDSICDALAEQLSLALCRDYRETTGLIQHHNVDKVLLCAGRSEAAFGGGRILEPIEIFLAGRAVPPAGNLDEQAAQVCQDWLGRHLHALDPSADVRLHTLVRPGSSELVELYRRQERTGAWLANDTSCGVAFAPLTAAETVALEVERGLSGATYTSAHPEVGEDIKVMCVRRGRHIDLTVSAALIGRYLDGMEAYRTAVAAIEERARSIASDHWDGDIAVTCNAADDPEAGEVYLTVTGTSAEAGDDGEAGRGNRVNGLITPYRPMTMESLAGKNPVTHVGKLYNLVAALIAQDIVAEVPEVASVQCLLVSRIGHPIDDPQVVHLQLAAKSGGDVQAFAGPAERIVARQLAAIGGLADDLLSGALAFDRWPLRSQD